MRGWLREHDDGMSLFLLTGIMLYAWRAWLILVHLLLLGLLCHAVVSCCRG